MSKENLIQRVEAALNTIRPHLISDGGDIKVVDITPDNKVLVKLLGSCESCPMSFMTMKAGVEMSIKSLVPEITSIEAISNEQLAAMHLEVVE
ncbi:MAG: NifU family protein [Sphingobacteriales bacterium]|jgi:Fe-S cluster biogenesis protein NfuA|nr:NifU family protein [Sphingobacteriales bacterium]